MHSKLSLLLVLAMAIYVTNVLADCGDPPSSDEGEVKTWFKNLGCSIKKGAEDLGDASKPIVDKIGSSAKELGTSIQNKYHELKSKLSSEEDHVENKDNVPNLPTEKVPLAPLSGAPIPASAA